MIFLHQLVKVWSCQVLDPSSLGARALEVGRVLSQFLRIWNTGRLIWDRGWQFLELARWLPYPKRNITSSLKDDAITRNLSVFKIESDLMTVWVNIYWVYTAVKGWYIDIDRPAVFCESLLDRQEEKTRGGLQKFINHARRNRESWGEGAGALNNCQTIVDSTFQRAQRFTHNFIYPKNIL